MKQEFSYPSGDGRTQIHAIKWLPKGEPAAILQIAHGMVEFIDRYDAFAQFLTGNGLMVVGNDHLGHGLSVAGEEEYGFFAERDGNACVLGDLRRLQELVTGEHPGLPYFFRGHSMGSFLARQYIQRHGEELTGAIIMGTGAQPGFVLALGKRMCASKARKHGWHYRDEQIDRMALGANNKKFEPARTPADWLTRDEAVVDAYLAHPWNTFRFTVNGYYWMFTSIQEAQDRARIGKIRKDLPILLVSGAEDPVGGFGRGVHKVFEGFRDAGLRDVEMKLYPEDRHEILNEKNREVVYADILAWMQAKAGGAGRFLW